MPLKNLEFPCSAIHELISKAGLLCQGFDVSLLLIAFAQSALNVWSSFGVNCVILDDNRQKILKQDYKYASERLICQIFLPHRRSSCISLMRLFLLLIDIKDCSKRWSEDRVRRGREIIDLLLVY